MVDDRTLKSAKKHAEFFADLAINEYDLQICFKPSIIAVSCLICARKASKIIPEWNTKGFEQLTDYTYDGDILVCTEKLLMIYNK